MDYNAYQNALTECQVAKIHYNIYKNNGNLQDIIYTEKDTSTIEVIRNIKGSKILDSTQLYSLNAEMLTDVSWYVTPREAVIESIGKGNVVNLTPNPNFSGKAVLTFEVHQNDGNNLIIEKPIKVKILNRNNIQ